MDNKTALVLATLVIAAFVADRFFFGGGLPLFLAGKLSHLIDEIAFWR